MNIFVITTLLLCIVVLSLGATMYRRHKYAIDFSTSFNEYDLPVILLRHKGIIYKFLIDTGASLSSVHSGFADKFDGRRRKANLRLFGLGDAEVDTMLSTTLQYADKTFRVNMAINPMLDSSFERVGNSPIHGLLGSDFLNKYGIIVDFKTKKLYLK
jgi:hypothetical protein